MAETDSQRRRSYLLPVEDQQFLLRDELRGVRFQLEYSKAELLLRDWGIRSVHSFSYFWSRVSGAMKLLVRYGMASISTGRDCGR